MLCPLPFVALWLCVRPRQAMNKPLYREITPKVRILSESEGLVEYVASDQTLDSYREIIMANGWRFDARFVKNPVFVDSHSYSNISSVIVDGCYKFFDVILKADKNEALLAGEAEIFNYPSDQRLSM